MKRKIFLLLALLPFMLGMSAEFKEISPYSGAAGRCYKKCNDERDSCYRACVIAMFFQKDATLARECFEECHDKNLFCGYICEYRSQENDWE
jgi:hypothetical protein